MAGEHNTLVYLPPGGESLEVASGGAINVASGGSVTVASGGTFTLAGKPQTFTMVAAAAGTNVCEVTITVKDGGGTTVAAPVNFDLWLSDSATGEGLTATTASGTVTAKAASGAVLGTYTAKKALRVQSLATGIFILEITDTAKTAFKVCAAAPETGLTVVGETLATGDYG